MTPNPVERRWRNPDNRSHVEASSSLTMCYGRAARHCLLTVDVFKTFPNPPTPLTNSSSNKSRSAGSRINLDIIFWNFWETLRYSQSATISRGVSFEVVPSCYYGRRGSTRDQPTDHEELLRFLEYDKWFSRLKRDLERIFVTQLRLNYFRKCCNTLWSYFYPLFVRFCFRGELLLKDTGKILPLGFGPLLPASCYF